jgi:hypothetical protein
VKFDRTHMKFYPDKLWKAIPKVYLYAQCRKLYLYYPYSEKTEDICCLVSSFYFVVFAAINVKQQKEIITLKDGIQMAYRPEIF